MSSRIDARLAELGITLPEAPAPAANYVPFMAAAGLVQVSGQISRDDRGLISGKLGANVDVVELSPDTARHLARHGIQARVREVAPDHRAVGQVLLDEAREAGADLLVMGAYSHSRLRGALLGGVTRHVLAHAELPVLMAH